MAHYLINGLDDADAVNEDAGKLLEIRAMRMKGAVPASP